MRKRLLVLFVMVGLGVALPGCQLLLDLLGGGGFPVMSDLPGGDITVRLENHSGFKVIVEAEYTSGDTLVRDTVRILEASGPESNDTILATHVQQLKIIVKADTPFDSSDFFANSIAGERISSDEFRWVFDWGIDFRSNETFVFNISGPFIPPAEIIDCDGDGISDSDAIAACTDDPGCADCNNNSVPDACDIGELVPAIVDQPPSAVMERLGASLTTDSLGEGLTPEMLVDLLVGPGVSVSNVQYHGSALGAGRFDFGMDVVGMENGIVLSSGNVLDIPGLNELENESTNFEAPGDGDLNNLLGDQKLGTNDAAVLEFDFTCDFNNFVQFRYVFASEEYNEFIHSSYNDVFAFFLNGQNVAIVPGTESTPVAIQTINCGDTPGTTDGPNCDLFINNDCFDIPPGTYPCAGNRNTEMDGLTVVLTASGQTMPGVNHIKIAIADTSDFDLDSAVFLQGVSFVCQPLGGACCLAEAHCQTITADDCAKIGGCYLGDGSDCASANCTDGISLDCNVNGAPDECVPTTQPVIGS